MAEQLQLRRGTTAEHAVFTGAVGEATVDTDKDVIVVHDGTTVGGFPLAKQSDVALKAVDAEVVKLTGDQSVAGIKTFTSIPVVPATSPTTDNQVTRKKYVDDGLALKTGIGTATPLAPAVTAVVGVSTNASRQDHVHPTNFTATATDIKMNGTQAVGSLVTFARADHVHPSDTSKADLALINWRDTMMSKAEFNAMAAMTRNIYAGSGHIEFGKALSGETYVNEGMWTQAPASNVPNIFKIGTLNTSAVGTSKSPTPICSINGTLLNILGVNKASDSSINSILLPPAPTILPSTATLTQQQIDSGVIKHADASNSGLIVNGKFDTDTSGWVATRGTISVSSGKLLVTCTDVSDDNFNVASTAFNVIAGKNYVLELDFEKGTAPSFSPRILNGSNATVAILATGVSTSGRYSYTFNSGVETLIKIFLRVDEVGTNGVTALFDNIAVFPADAISRSDLVFLESWHEDVSEKDFVYPLGNVQYLGTTGDAGTPVAGAFAGAATYSLFSDTWQADSALVGKGYVWSTLSDANKKAFVANPENNCYLDGDKVVQVRYRVRVVMGLGDSWGNVDTQLNSRLEYNTTYARAQTKGKAVSILSDFTNGDYSFFIGKEHTSNTIKESGIFQAYLASSLAYEGKCFALPIALVHRRNQGAYHPVYNANGSKLASDGNKWYNTAVSFASIADAMTDTKLTTASGYIGTISARADGIFYDQVHEADITDLRNSSQKVEDYNRLIDREFNKAVSGVTRGSEGEWKLIDVNAVQASTATNTSGINIPTGGTSRYAAGDKVFIECISDAVRMFVTVTSVGDTSISFANQIVIPTRTINALYCVSKQISSTKSNTLTHCDILGNPANYPTAWKQSGVFGTPLIVAEDGTSLLPTGTTGSDGLATFKVSRKANATPLQVLKSTDSGATWTALTVTTHYTFNTTTNAITFTAGNIPLVAYLVKVVYATHTSMATPTVNSEVLAIGDGYSTSAYHVAYGVHLNHSMIGKVGISSNGPFSLVSPRVDKYTIDTSIGNKIATSLLYSPESISGSLGTTTTPAVKVFPYLTRSNGKAYLQLVFKEMKYGSYAAPTVVTAASATYTINMTYKINIAGCALDGKVIQWTASTATVAVDWSLYDVSPTGVIYLLSSGAVYANARLYDGDSWGDDSKFNIVDNVSTTTDTNGATVLIGQKRIELPYFIGASE